MRKRILSLLLCIVLCLSLLPMSAFPAYAASDSLADVSYTYGAQSNAVRISGYSESAYNSAMALLEKNSYLGELLSSGDGTEANPFLIRNFIQLRYLFFWMNFAECNIEFRFVENNTTIVPSEKWASLLQSYGTNPSNYRMNGSVYARLADDITATVTDSDCTSLFECAVNIGVHGNEYAHYLTLVSDLTFHFSTNGRRLTVTLTGDATEDTFSFLYSSVGKLDLFDDTKWGSITVSSTVRYTAMRDFSKRANFCIPFYIADFPEIRAKTVSLSAVGSTGTSAYLLKGERGYISFSTLEYSRHTSSTIAGMGFSKSGIALDFSDEIVLDAVVFHCDHAGSGYTLSSANISIEHTDIPESISGSNAKNISINYAKIGGSITVFFGGNAYAALRFVDVAGDMEFLDSQDSPVNLMNIFIDHCSATRYRDSIHCESVFITDSTFIGEGKLTNDFSAQKVTVHASTFVGNIAERGVVNFERLHKSGYEYVKFTDTQIVNAAVGYAVEFPELYGYHTAKDEFGQDYVISYPTITGKHFYFRNCSLSVKPGSAGTYAYLDPTNLQLDPDASIYEKKLLGIKILTENCSDGRMAYVNSIGLAVSFPISGLAWGDISGSGHHNTEKLLADHGDILSMVDTSYTSFIIENNGHEKYTLTYNANGGASFPLKSETQYDDGYITIAYGEREVFKDGYDFLGWSTDPAATKATYQKGDRIYLEKDTVLYAVLIRSYLNVTYQFNGGTENGATSYTQAVKNGSVIKINKDETGKNRLCDPKQEFKVVAGWSDLYNPITVKYTEGTEYTVTDDVTFYAVWDRDTSVTYKVQFKNKDGGQHTSYMQYGGTVLTVPKGCPAPEGERFVAWRDTSGGKDYAPGDKYSVTGNSVLVPVFEVIPESEIMHTIETVNVKGVTVPVEETVCVTDGALTGGDHYTARYKGGSSTWEYTDSKGYTISLNPADTFIGGRHYTVYVEVTPTADNYSFSTDTVFKIMDKDARVVSASGRTYTIAASFRCTERQLIRNISVTNLTYPLAGEYPSSTITVKSTSTSTLGTTILRWFQGSVQTNSQFVSGRVYHAEIEVKVPSSAWAFSQNLTVTVNGSATAVKDVIYQSNNSVVKIVLADMSVDKQSISTCTITGAPEPWINSEPEYPTLNCATNQYSAKIRYWSQIRNGREYEYYTGNSNTIFIGTGTVRAYVQITPASGYALSGAPAITINGMTAIQEGSEYYIEFTPKEPEVITALSISGVPELLEGETIDFHPQIVSNTSHTKAELNTYPVEIWSGDDEITVTPVWVETDLASWDDTMLTEGAVVKRDQYYKLYVAVTHDAGYEFSNDLNYFNVSVNGGLYHATGVKDIGNTKIFEIGMSGIAVPGLYSVSGKVTSFGASGTPVSMQLIRSGSDKVNYQTTVKGLDAEYTISGVKPGVYTMKVTKQGHIPYACSVIVGEEDVELDLTLEQVFSGSFSGNKLVWTYNYAPDNGVSNSGSYYVIAAEYNQQGKLLHSFVTSASAYSLSQKDMPTNLTKTVGHTYKLFLLKYGTSAPLCLPWSETVK